MGLYTRNDPEWERNMPKEKNLDVGSARAPDFGEAIFLFLLNGMVLAYARKINNKRFPARARTRLENRTDPNPQITGRSPNSTPLSGHVGVGCG